MTTTADVRQAVTEAALVNGTVTLPAGVYELDETLTLSPDVTLIGAGLHRTILRATQPMYAVINMAQEAVQISRGGIRDLTVDANGLATFGVRLLHVARVAVQRVRATSAMLAAVMLEGCVHVELDLEAVSSVIGLRIGASPEGEPSRFIRARGVLQSNQVGFHVEAAAGIYFQALEIDHNDVLGSVNDLCPAGEGIAFVLGESWCEQNNGPLTLDPARSFTALHVIRDTHILSGTRDYGIVANGVRYHLDTVVAQNAQVADFFETSGCVRTTAGQVLGTTILEETA